MPATEPSVLLLGGGYALSRLACRLAPGTFVLTSRSEEKVRNYRSKGFVAELFDLSTLSTLVTILQKYPTLESVIDGVPPPTNLFRDNALIPGEGASHIAEMIECFQLCSIKRALYLSTTGVYGVSDGSMVDESTPVAPTRPKAKARLYVEAAYQSSWLACACLRISGIYGPGRGIGHALKHGSYRLISDGELWSNRIHVDDLVSTIITLLKRSELPKVVCISDDSPAKLNEVVRYYCDHFHLPYPSQLSVDSPATEEHTLRTPNQRVSNHYLREILGITLQYPSYREGADSEFEVSAPGEDSLPLTN